MGSMVRRRQVSVRNVAVHVLGARALLVSRRHLGLHGFNLFLVKAVGSWIVEVDAPQRGVIVGGVRTPQLRRDGRQRRIGPPLQNDERSRSPDPTMYQILLTSRAAENWKIA